MSTVTAMRGQRLVRKALISFSGLAPVLGQVTFCANSPPPHSRSAR